MSTARPDAIIFVPGLHGDPERFPVQLVAAKIASALDRNARTAEAVFESTERRPVQRAVAEPGRGGAGILPDSTIERTDGDESRPVIEIFEYRYVPTLIKRHVERSPLKQAVSIILLIAGNLPRLIRAFFRPAKSFTDTLQAAYGSIMLMMMALYMLVLLATAGLTVVEAFPNNPLAGLAGGFADWLDDAFMWTQRAVVILAGAGLFVRNSLKQVLSAVSTEYAAAIDYINLAEQRGAIAGRLEALLEDLAESGKYRKIHVMAYSFGSIIAYDTIFQANPPDRRLEEVDTLITIGSPFDIVRSFWPAYFTRRHAASDSPPRWINVYVALDFMASNFRNDSETAPATEGIALVSGGGASRVSGDPSGDDESGDAGDASAAPATVISPENQEFRVVGVENLSLLDRLRVSATRLHTSYWGSDADDDVTCLGPVLRAMYEDDAILS